MKLKCIGGPNDGEWHEVQENLHLNDVVQIQGKIKSCYTWEMPEYLQDTITINYNWYIIKELRYKSVYARDFKWFRYLIPHNEDEWECLVKQLEK